MSIFIYIWHQLADALRTVTQLRSVAVIRRMIGEIIASDNFAFRDNIKIIEIALMDNIILVYNVMLMPDNMFVLDNFLSFAAVKFLHVDRFEIILHIHHPSGISPDRGHHWRRCAVAITIYVYIKILLPSAPFVESVTITHTCLYDV